MSGAVEGPGGTTCRHFLPSVLINSPPPPPPPSLHPSILPRGTTRTNVPPGAAPSPRWRFSSVHKKNTGSSSLCFSFSFSFCCCGVSGRSALLAFFTVSGPLNKTRPLFHAQQTHTHTHTQEAGRHKWFNVNKLSFALVHLFCFVLIKTVCLCVCPLIFLSNFCLKTVCGRS